MQLDADQQQFLDDRLQQLAEEQPEIFELRDRLLKIGGCHLVAPTQPEPDLHLLLQEGAIMQGVIKLEEMARNSCHWNAAYAWKNRMDQVIAIGTGYALSEDGLWRQHSWGLIPTGILETTELRHTYFGIRLEGINADQFAAGHEI